MLIFSFPARLSNMQIEKQVKFSFKNFRFQSCVKCYLFSASYSFIIQGNSKTLFNWFVKFLRKKYANYVQNKFL